MPLCLLYHILSCKEQHRFVLTATAAFVFVMCAKSRSMLAFTISIDSMQQQTQWRQKAYCWKANELLHIEVLLLILLYALSGSSECCSSHDYNTSPSNIPSQSHPIHSHTATDHSSEPSTMDRFSAKSALLAEAPLLLKQNMIILCALSIPSALRLAVYILPQKAQLRSVEQDVGCKLINLTATLARSGIVSDIQRFHTPFLSDTGVTTVLPFCSATGFWMEVMWLPEVVMSRNQNAEEHNRMRHMFCSHSLTYQRIFASFSWQLYVTRT